MGDHAFQMSDYLQWLREGRREEAFFALLEMDHGVLPELIAAFRAEPDHQVRAFIVEVVWQHRQPSVIPFLGEALCDSEPAVWQQAMDGLVSLGSPAALGVLRSARTRQFRRPRDADSFLASLEEAIAQVESQ